MNNNSQTVPGLAPDLTGVVFTNLEARVLHDITLGYNNTAIQERRELTDGKRKEVIQSIYAKLNLDIPGEFNQRARAAFCYTYGEGFGVEGA